MKVAYGNMTEKDQVQGQMLNGELLNVCSTPSGRIVLAEDVTLGEILDFDVHVFSALARPSLTYDHARAATSFSS